MVLLIFIGVAFAGMVVWFIFEQQGAVSAKAKARDDYHHSLQSLSLAPNDAKLKQRTLQLGREYSELTRNGQGVTIHDEVAVMNDLNAACAAVGNGSPLDESRRVPTINQSESLVKSRLLELNQLRDAGLISADEFSSLRADLLAKLTSAG